MRRWRWGWMIVVVLLLSACGTGEEPAQPASPTEQEEASLSWIFQGVRGCAVWYDPAQGVVSWCGDETLCRTQVSPCSTFKIISALLGLHHGVLTGAESTMAYTGAWYPVPDWNRDLTLSEAFSSSCVWYFRQVIDQVGPERTARALEDLGYGNQDLSQWEGGGQNRSPELNGFWLDSSLKISPREQVKVLAALFEGRTSYPPEEVAVLQELMLTQDNGIRQVYGKTGTGFGETGWFVGFAQEGETRTYFAVYLADETREISGQDARAVALTLLDEAADLT